MNIIKEVFTELRMLPFTENSMLISDETLTQAVTLNENLMEYGYTLRPEDIIRLAKSENLYTFFELFTSCLDTIDAEPMYPDFPSQVMEFDKATLKFHQLVHYFSTYGIEKLFGNEVKKGWLPEVEKTQKKIKDTKLLDSKVIELVNYRIFNEKILINILTKRERMTNREKILINEVIHKIDKSIFTSFTIPFKQNLLIVFEYLMKDRNRRQNLDLMYVLCKHTGDVFKCLDYYLTQRNFHLTTSEKRTAVKLIEMYSSIDLKSNLILSNKKSERVILVLQYLDYNQYSRSQEHYAAVADLRNGNLRSWEGQAKWLIKNAEQTTVLKFLAERPGMLLRMIAWLLRLGYDKELIFKSLAKNASSLSLFTLNAILVKFGRSENNPDLYDIVERILFEKMKTLDTDIKGKRIFIKEGSYNLEQSIIDPEKSKEGGYVRSGLSFYIPKDVNVIRFFTYWNDNKRVDLDLHAVALCNNGDFFQIGYDSSYYDGDIVMSGDITHSDAAEYIDVNLNNEIVSKVFFNINIFKGAPNFSEIEKCYTGMLAVDKTEKDVELYNPENCFFSHDLRSNLQCINYAVLDVNKRVLTLIVKECRDVYSADYKLSKFTLKSFLNNLLIAQNASLVDSEDDAEIIVSIDKSDSENGISLIDKNFYLD